jgi:hypothetical protein
MRYAAVTSFSQDGFDRYGKRMIETFLENGPQDTYLHVFSDDGLETDITDHRVIFYSLAETVPLQKVFEDRHQSPICHGKFGNTYDYRFDAVRFSHKPAAIWSALNALKDDLPDVLIWFDGDTVFKTPMTHEFLEEKLPIWSHIGHFSRNDNHTEAGILMFRLSEKNVRYFIEIFWQIYVTDQVFRLPAWTDCHVFDTLAAGARADGFLRVVNLGDEVSHNTHHPIVNSDWYQYVDHLKGNRKESGSSHDDDMLAPTTLVQVNIEEEN